MRQNRPAISGQNSLALTISFYFYFEMRNVKPIREINDAMYVPGGIGILIQVMGKRLSEFASVDAAIQAYIPWAIGEILTEINPIMIMSLFYSTYMVGTSFSNKTVDLTNMQGYTRKQIFISKVIVYYVTSMLIAVIFLLIFIFLTFGVYWLKFMSFGHVMMCMLVWIYLGLAMMSIPLLITFISRDVLKTILLNFLLYALLIIPAKTTLRYSLFSFYPTFAARDPTVWSEEILLPITQWRFSLSVMPALLIIGSILISYFFFRKAELK